MGDDRFIAWNKTIMLLPSMQWLSKRVDKEIDWASFKYILNSNYFVYEDTNRNCEAIPKRLEISLLNKLFLKCVQASMINPSLCCKPCRLEVIKLHPFANESIPLQCGRKSTTHLSENVCNQKELNCAVLKLCCKEPLSLLIEILQIKSAPLFEYIRVLYVLFYNCCTIISSNKTRVTFNSR